MNCSFDAKTTVEIYEQAIADIREVAEWYEQRAEGLGDRFKLRVLRQIDLLSDSAFHHAARYDDVRCFKIEKFPFNIHYIIVEKEVQIFAVIHTSRNPTIWRRKKQ